jgi:hypothetical protein
MVVKEPAVEVLVTDCRLDRVEVHPDQYALPGVFAQNLQKRRLRGGPAMQNIALKWFSCKILIAKILCHRSLGRRP